jgi:hypothetical protein
MRAVIALGLLVVLTGTAAAQPLPWRMDDRVGPGWTVTPGLSGGAAWDSTVQTGSHPLVEALFQKYVGRVSPHAEIDFIGRRTRFNAGYSGALDKYWGGSTGYEQHSRISMSRVVTSRFSAAADAGYSAAPATDRLRLADTAASLADTTLPFVQIDAAYLTAGSSFQYRASPRITLSGAYRYREVTLDRDEAFGDFELLRDGRAHAPTLQIMRTFSPRLSIGGGIEYRLELVGANEDFDVQTAAAAFSYRISSTTAITGGGGASRLEVLSTTASTIAPTFHGGFEHTRRRLEITGSYSRGFHQILGFGSLASSDTFSGGAVAPLLDRTYYLSALVAFSRSRAVEAVGLGFDLNTTWTNAAVGRRLAPWLKAEAYLSIAFQTSAVRGDSNRTRLGVQFVTATPVRMQ